MMIPLKKATLLVLLSMMTSMSACAVLNGGTETGTETDTETKQPVVYTPFVLDVSDSSYETNEQQTTVTVSKNAVNTVKKELFGDNLSWRGNGYGVYDPETDSFNETLLEAIKNCGVTTLRYPGGIEGDYFIWHETIGEDRELQIDPFSSQYPTYFAGGDGKKYYPYFGLEEFMEMCTQIGIEAVVQLNAGTGTPKDAADLVRWCEEHNYPVSSYAIGNEVHFAEERVMFTPSTKTPEEYIDFANEVYAELGDLADTVELGIIGLPAEHALCRDPEWDEKVLKALGDKIDFIDCHYGYTPYFTSETDSAEDIYKSYMAAPTYIKGLIQDTKNSLAAYTDRADEISIQITEYGTIGTLYNYNGTAGAVFVASLIQVMANEPMISSANHLPMLNHPASASLVGYDPTGAEDKYWDNVKTYIFRWYSEQIGRDVLATEATVPTFSSKAIGLIPDVAEAEMSNTAVYYDRETGKGSVFVINQSVDKNMVFQVELPFNEIKITAINELYSSNPVLYNGAGSPLNVTPKSYEFEDPNSNGKITLTTNPISVVRVDFETCG